MTDTKNAIRLIETFGDAVEGGIVYDDEGGAAFAASDRVLISINHLPNTNQIVLHAELGNLHSGADAIPFLHLLAAENLELAALLGGALALDASSRTVALFARMSVENVGASTFEDWVGDVAEAAEVWAKRLSEANVGKAA